jgi:hypothetical protein
MPDLQSKDEQDTYTCGKCRGKILYLRTDGRPDKCPECGYGHGTRRVNDVPSVVKLNLNDL